ncbi:hypothetical protein SNEBB_011414 [Seison nebaliae]|nr:hypothetical protein SNEBB_011414 [Seison nebaliae]
MKSLITTAILKPDVISNPVLHQRLIRSILSFGFIPSYSKIEKIEENRVRNLYEIHEKKFFYDRLVTSLKSAESHILCLSHIDPSVDVPNIWRKFIGTTKIYQSIFFQPYSLRNRCGLSDTRNACHGADNSHNAKEEFFQLTKLNNFQSIIQQTQLIHQLNLNVNYEFNFINYYSINDDIEWRQSMDLRELKNLFKNLLNLKK